MPGTDAQRRPIEPGIVARVTQGVRYALTGKAPDQWFGPSQPQLPVAQTEAVGRQFDYQTGFNLQYVPRGNEQISFAQLRGLADGSDILRLAIETRKDQICKLAWGVRPRGKQADGKPAKPDDRCQQIADFLLLPDREHDWQTWLRMLLEDQFVIDAATIYPRATRGGGVYSLDLMDGALFKRILNTDGRTPIPPNPAYQQYLKGLPAVDYSRDELLYLPRNPRTHKIYGYSPVEQIIITVNIALRRQMSQLSYYTDGSTPDLIFSVPKEWNPDQIRQYSDWWESMLAGNLQNRRGAMFVTEGMKPFDTKERALQDSFDEWLARIVCYAFSLPPTAFTKQANRATAETAQEVALEEGLAPIMQWVGSAMNQIIWRWFGYSDLEFYWEMDQELDQLVRAQIDQIYVTAKVLTPDEVRQDSLGKPPLTQEQKDELSPPPPPALAAHMGQPGQPGQPFDGSPDPADPAAKLLKKKHLNRSIATAHRSVDRASTCGH